MVIYKRSQKTRRPISYLDSPLDHQFLPQLHDVLLRVAHAVVVQTYVNPDLAIGIPLGTHAQDAAQLKHEHARLVEIAGTAGLEEIDGPHVDILAFHGVSFFEAHQIQQMEMATQTDIFLNEQSSNCHAVLTLPHFQLLAIGDYAHEFHVG